jgi:hypothetical protein
MLKDYAAVDNGCSASWNLNSSETLATFYRYGVAKSGGA